MSVGGKEKAKACIKGKINYAFLMLRFGRLSCDIQHSRFRLRRMENKSTSEPDSISDLPIQIAKKIIKATTGRGLRKLSITRKKSQAGITKEPD